MKKFFISLYLTGLTALLSANAIEIAMPQAGELKYMTIDTSADAVSVTGPLNMADLVLIKEQFANLTSLDLSQAEIVAYMGPAVDGRQSWPAAYIPDMFFAGMPLVEVALPQSQAITLGDGAFASTRLQTVDLNMAVMGKGVFAGCNELTSATISRSVVEPYTFADCENLESVTLATPCAIGESAFQGCSALKYVAKSDLATSIGARAFAGCHALGYFNFWNKLTDIGEEAFAGLSIKNVNLSHATALTAIGDRAFAFNPDLEYVNFGTVAPQLGQGLFFGDSALTTITLPLGSDGKVPAYTFTGATNVDITTALPADYTELGDYSLLGMANIVEYLVPATLTHIGTNAMEGWTSLAEINAYDTAEVPTLGDDVWAGIDPATVRLLVKEPMEEPYKAAPQWQDFMMVVDRESGVAQIVADSGISAHFEGSVLRVASTGSNIESVRLYDVAGKEIAALTPRALAAHYDTADSDNRIYIVQIATADGKVATKKLMRR